MFIDDPETFKTWLTLTLDPLCDADPDALAKYVYALVRKEKPLNELKESMYNQLEVFLQNETVLFLDILFNALETQNFQLPSARMEEPSAELLEGPSVASVAPVKIKVERSTSLPVSFVPPLPCPPPQTNVPPLPILAPLPPQISPVEQDRAVAITNIKQIKEQENRSNAMNHVNSIQLNNSTFGSALLSAVQNREMEQHIHHMQQEVHSDCRSKERKSDSDKDERIRDRRARRRSTPSPIRNRSRSRSWEARPIRRSRSRDRERREREDRSRAWRNISPPNRRYERDRDRYMRSWSKSPNRGRDKSCSPVKPRGRYRNRSPPNRSRSRSRSKSNDNIDKALKQLFYLSEGTEPSSEETLPSSGSTTHVGDSSSYSKKTRCRDFDEKGYCMLGDLCPHDHGIDPVVLEEVALPQVLSYPHDSSSLSNQGPVSSQPTPPGMESTLPPLPCLPPLPLPHSMHHPPPPPQIRNSNMAEYNPDAPSMEPRIWGRPAFRGGAPLGHSQSKVAEIRIGAIVPPPHQRELINIPVQDSSGNYVYPPPPPQPTMQLLHPQQFQAHAYKRSLDFHESNVHTAAKRGRFDFGRLGPRLMGLNKPNPMFGGNCSLELKKIPRGVNNISHLNDHFAKFGKIINIQVYFEADPEGALITFSSHAEANAAYKSTEAVLNNRFIKVFWHNPAGKSGGENVPPPRSSVKERLGSPVLAQSPTKVLNTLQPSQVQTQSQEHEKVVLSGSTLTKTLYIPTALKKNETLHVTTPNECVQKPVQTNIAAAKILKSQAILAAKETLKKRQEEKQKEAIKLTADLRKRKQDLLQKQIKEQKLLIERLEKGGIIGEQREVLMNTIKSHQKSIENIRKDLASVVKPGLNKLTPGQIKTNLQQARRNREEMQREILDAELDLFNNRQEGKDTSELQRRVIELKMKAHSLGLVSSGRGRLAYRGTCLTRGTLRGKGRGSFTHVSVDHRPTMLLVSGYEVDDKIDVLAHFARFGEIADYNSDESTPSLVLNFKSRIEAETAMLNGRNFQDRLLSVTWAGSNPQVNRNLRGSSNVLTHRSVMLMEDEVHDDLLEVDDEDDELGLSLELNEEFLLQDEDEDEEDRTWRR